jgi:hypothetical protein
VVRNGDDECNDDEDGGEDDDEDDEEILSLGAEDGVYLCSQFREEDSRCLVSTTLS